MVSHAVSLPTAHIPYKRLIQGLDPVLGSNSKVLVWPSRAIAKPRSVSFPVRAMGSSASSQSQQADSTGFEPGINI